MTRFSHILLGLWIGWALLAGGSFLQASPSPQNDLQSLADEGLRHFYSLEYDQAISLFERLRDQEPNNPAWHNHLAMAYFYKQLYVAGLLQGDLFSSSNKFFRTRKIQTDPTLEKRFQQANQAVLRICEQRLKRNEKDEEALYACGVAHAARATHQGLIERSRFGFIGSAGKAYDYHSRLLGRNPRYYDAYLVTGVYDFVLGSLPGPLKVLLFFAGLTGDKQRGIRAVESVTQWGDRAREDAKIVLTVMYRREKRYADARRTLNDLAQAFPRNYILPLEIASIHRAAGQDGEAIRGYEQVRERVEQGAAGYAEAPVARIHFELGELYRKAGDLEAARKHFQQVAGSRGSTPELEKESALLSRQIEDVLRQRTPEREEVPAPGDVARRNLLPD